PTGAAIVRHLGCAAGPGPQPRRLAGTGIGFGSRRLPGISNVLRVLVLMDEPAATMEGGGGRDEVAAIEFEVDDQTAEDLAAGLDRLRAMPDVLDVLQMPAFGKKGRLVSHVRVLARCDGEAAVVAACFRETATIGLRVQTVRRAVLDRRSAIVEVDGRAVPVKIVARPDGVRTAKAESDALAADASAGRAGRERLRRAAEEAALLRRDGTDEE
ncbi:MAG TPA: nickel insertion protein, partial [Stellaceae bacterium]